MARTDKKLINFHGSVKGNLEAAKGQLYPGEIAVVHVDQKDSLLAIKDNANENLVYFVASAAVVSMIEEKAGSDVTKLSGATEALSASVVSIETKVEANEGHINDISGHVETLESVVGTAIDGYDTLCNEVDRLSQSATSVNTRLDNLDAVSAKTITAITVNTVDATVSAGKATVTIDADDIEYTDDVTVEGAIGALESRATTLEGLHAKNGNAFKKVSEEINGAIDLLDADLVGGEGFYIKSVKEENGVITATAGATSEFDAAGAAATAKSEAIAAASASANTLYEAITANTQAIESHEGLTNKAFSGLTTSEDGFIKKYVDDRVSSVYRYQGSVDTYEDLPKEGMEVGDVYNVVSAHTTTPVFPAGTNVAWDGSDWDVLGGTIDLDKLATKEELNAVSGATNDLVAALDQRIDSLETSGITAINGESEGYVTIAVTTPVGKATERNLVVAEKVQSLNDADDTHMGLAEASDVKSYVDTKVGAESARTDTEIANAIASAATSADTLNTAIEALDGEVIKGLSAGTTNNINLSFTAKDANGLVKINATAVTGSVATADDAAKLATAGDVKTYVDTAAANAIASAATSADTLLTKITANEQAISALETSAAASAQTAETNAKSYADGLKQTIDAYTVNGHAISTNPVLGSGDIALTAGTTGVVIAKDTTMQGAVQTLATTIADFSGATDTAIDDLDTRLVTVEGSYVNAATITGTTEGTGSTQTVTASISENNLTIDFSEMVIDCGTF